MRKMYENEELDAEFYEIMENKYDFSEILEKHNSYEYFYYLSNIRENLFAWYPFKEDANLLEIGSGYGALTKLFCKKVKDVVTIEDTPEKAEIISKRCSVEDNLRVLVNDFSNIEVSEKFDYIVLSDVFEYAKSFFESSTPFKSYLMYLRNYLKEDGVILLAISNRFGLKYFAGFKEEHVDEYFTGIDDYPNQTVKTFTKGEFETLLNNAGFSNYKFFYPYPDHVFPEVINTDKFINKICYERKATIIKERANFFRENKVNQRLSNENLSQYFANSFLIEIRNDDSFKETDNYDYIKISADRKERNKIVTYIYSDSEGTKVVKAPLNIFSSDHLRHMHEGSKYDFGKINFLENTFENNEFSYKYIEQKSAEKVLIEYINNNDKDKFFELLSKFFDALFYDSFMSDEYCTPEFLNIFKVKSDKSFHCHSITNLDVIFSNLFIIDDEFVSIDYEWIFDFSVPLEYIFFRVINHHYVSNPLFRDFISLEEIFEYFDLDIEDFALFKQWERFFLDYAILHMKKPKASIVSKASINQLNTLNISRYLAVERENRRLNKKIEKQQELIDAYKYSTSWKVTGPLRKIGFLLKK